MNQQVSNSSMHGSKNLRSLELEIERLNRQLKEGASSSKDVRSLEMEISRLKISLQQGADHSECKNIQRGLEQETRSLKQEIESLLAKLRSLEREVVILREQAAQSPKKTVVTTEGKRSIIISHVDRDT